MIPFPLGKECVKGFVGVSGHRDGVDAVVPRRMIDVKCTMLEYNGWHSIGQPLDWFMG